MNENFMTRLGKRSPAELARTFRRSLGASSYLTFELLADFLALQVAADRTLQKMATRHRKLKVIVVERCHRTISSAS